jgi:hypothetical protein
MQLFFFTLHYPFILVPDFILLLICDFIQKRFYYPHFHIIAPLEQTALQICINSCVFGLIIAHLEH